MDLKATSGAGADLMDDFVMAKSIGAAPGPDLR
jgi:hypothetical protein